jgi:MFS family permease
LTSSYQGNNGGSDRDDDDDNSNNSVDDRSRPRQQQSLPYRNDFDAGIHSLPSPSTRNQKDDIYSVMAWTRDEQRSASPALSHLLPMPSFVASSSTPSPSSNNWHRPEKGTWKDILFGFLYEDDFDDDDMENGMYHSSTADPPVVSLFLQCGVGKIHGSLFASLFLFAVANAVPVALASHMIRDESLTAADATPVTQQQQQSATTATTQLAAVAVVGMSLGKLLNGPLVDIVGARRISSLYTLGLSLSLILLACTPNLAHDGGGVGGSTWRHHYPRFCYGLIEFFSAVQWPSALVVLASHHRGNPNGAYEGGVYLVSLACRSGSLVGIVACSRILGLSFSPTFSWRPVALVGSWLALLSVAVTYLYVQDAPGIPDQPQNPVDPDLIRKWFPDYYYTSRNSSPDDDGDNDYDDNIDGVVRGKASWNPDHRRHVLPPQRTPFQRLGMLVRLAIFVVHRNVIPSLRHILLSPVFWLIAAAHTGCAMVRTSDRVLSSYLADTRSSTITGAIDGDRAFVSSYSSGLAAAFLGAGSVLGLTFAGSVFATRPERERKWLVSKLYLLTIVSCYALSVLAIPAIGRVLREPNGDGDHDPGGLLTVLQGIAIAAAGFGIAVPLYHIPSLVGAGFGCDKGLFLSYVDGVAYGLASLVWRVVGDAVQHSSNGSGWAYGWAAVALLVIPCAVLMVEFMEHYFCRHRYGGSLETILIA